MNARGRRFLLRIAMHEAGHAVAAFAVRRQVLRISTLSMPDKTKARISVSGAPMYVNERCRDNPKARRWIENDLLFLYAGPAAEARVFGWNPRGSMVDVAWAKLHAGYLHRGEAARAACLRSGRARAVEFVSEPQQWVQIEALAEVLVVRGELSSRKARAVCEAAKQGLRFQELIEAENRRIQEGIKQSDEPHILAVRDLPGWARKLLE
jgi:hypothetical protein